MEARSGFTVGRDVGVYGRWFRLVVGVYFTLLLTVVPFIQDPVPASELFSFLGRLGFYFILILGTYLVAFYLLSERVLARMNPWVGTLIMLGPLAIISAFQLGPQAFRVALGVYINVSLILNFAMSYGGCEVIAIPTLIYRRRHTVYCPYNAVDAVENAMVSSPPGHRIFGFIALAVVLLVGSYYLLLDFMDLSNVFGVGSDKRWALLLLVPAAFLTKNSWLVYQKNDRQATVVVTNQAVGALVLVVLVAILFFRLNWRPFWVLFMVTGFLYALFKLFRSTRTQNT